MNRKQRIRVVKFSLGLISLMALGFGLYLLSRPWMDFRDIGGGVTYGNPFGWFFILLSIIVLATIPASIRSANRRADLEEMLDEYQKNKNRR